MVLFEKVSAYPTLNMTLLNYFIHPLALNYARYSHY
jgi:hypothetical protein